jgi:hypothetical protein
MVIYRWLAYLLAALPSLWAGSRGVERDKDVDILLLRSQLHIVQ